MPKRPWPASGADRAGGEDGARQSGGDHRGAKSAAGRLDEVLPPLAESAQATLVDVRALVTGPEAKGALAQSRGGDGRSQGHGGPPRHPGGAADQEPDADGGQRRGRRRAGQPDDGPARQDGRGPGALVDPGAGAAERADRGQPGGAPADGVSRAAPGRAHPRQSEQAP